MVMLDSHGDNIFITTTLVSEVKKLPEYNSLKANLMSVFLSLVWWLEMEFEWMKQGVDEKNVFWQLYNFACNLAWDAACDQEFGTKEDAKTKYEQAVFLLNSICEEH